MNDFIDILEYDEELPIGADDWANVGSFESE